MNEIGTWSFSLYKWANNYLKVGVLYCPQILKHIVGLINIGDAFISNLKYWVSMVRKWKEVDVKKKRKNNIFLLF